VLVLGAWLRIHNFDRPGLWIDEYGTWWVVAADGYAGVAARAWEVQGQSPLYDLIVRGCVDLFGLASWSLRLPSLVFGVLVLGLGYAVTREVFRDRRLALMATAALALNAPLIRYAQEARPYGLALALSLASFALFIRVLRGGGLAERVAYALVTAAIVYTHYLFGVVLLVQAGYAICQRTASRRPALLAFGGAALLAAPAGQQLWNLFARRRSLDWIADPVNATNALGNMAQKFIDPWPLGLAAITVVVLLASGARAWRGDPGDRPGLVLAWFIAPFGLVALALVLLDVNLFDQRYLLCAAPAARILVGALLALPRRRPIADALPLLVFTAATIIWVLLPHHARTGTFTFREDQHWDTAVSEMLAGFREGDRVLLATRFVEMDLVVAGTASPSTRDFVTWPFEAHLPAGVSVPYTPLPYTVSPATEPALEAIALEAFAAQRVWVLGYGPSVRAIAKFAADDPRITIVRRDRHGTAHYSSASASAAKRLSSATGKLW
jgi:4-amino-4-deoxy-L-arabinose transferase-like glycosyltransferase